MSNKKQSGIPSYARGTKATLAKQQGTSQESIPKSKPTTPRTSARSSGIPSYAKGTQSTLSKGKDGSGLPKPTNQFGYASGSAQSSGIPSYLKGTQATMTKEKQPVKMPLMDPLYYFIRDPATVQSQSKTWSPSTTPSYAKGTQSTLGKQKGAVQQSDEVNYDATKPATYSVPMWSASEIPSYAQGTKSTLTKQKGGKSQISTDGVPKQLTSTQQSEVIEQPRSPVVPKQSSPTKQVEIIDQPKSPVVAKPSTYQYYDAVPSTSNTQFVIGPIGKRVIEPPEQELPELFTLQVGDISKEEYVDAAANEIIKHIVENDYINKLVSEFKEDLKRLDKSNMDIFRYAHERVGESNNRFKYGWYEYVYETCEEFKKTKIILENNVITASKTMDITKLLLVLFEAYEYLAKFCTVSEDHFNTIMHKMDQNQIVQFHPVGETVKQPGLNKDMLLRMWNNAVTQLEKKNSMYLDWAVRNAAESKLPAICNRKIREFHRTRKEFHAELMLTLKNEPENAHSVFQRLTKELANDKYNCEINIKTFTAKGETEEQKSVQKLFDTFRIRMIEIEERNKEVLNKAKQTSNLYLERKCMSKMKAFANDKNKCQDEILAAMLKDSTKVITNLIYAAVDKLTQEKYDAKPDLLIEEAKEQYERSSNLPLDDQMRTLRKLLQESINETRKQNLYVFLTKLEKDEKTDECLKKMLDFENAVESCEKTITNIMQEDPELIVEFMFGQIQDMYTNKKYNCKYGMDELQMKDTTAANLRSKKGRAVPDVWHDWKAAVGKLKNAYLKSLKNMSKNQDKTLFYANMEKLLNFERAIRHHAEKILDKIYKHPELAATTFELAIEDLSSAKYKCDPINQTTGTVSSKDGILKKENLFNKYKNTIKKYEQSNIVAKRVARDKQDPVLLNVINEKIENFNVTRKKIDEKLTNAKQSMVPELFESLVKESIATLASDRFNCEIDVDMAEGKEKFISEIQSIPEGELLDTVLNYFRLKMDIIEIKNLTVLEHLKRSGAEKHIIIRCIKKMCNLEVERRVKLQDLITANNNDPGTLTDVMFNGFVVLLSDRYDCNFDVRYKKDIPPEERPTVAICDSLDYWRIYVAEMENNNFDYIAESIKPKKVQGAYVYIKKMADFLQQKEEYDIKINEAIDSNLDNVDDLIFRYLNILSTDSYSVAPEPTTQEWQHFKKSVFALEKERMSDIEWVRLHKSSDEYRECVAKYDNFHKQVQMYSANIRKAIIDNPNDVDDLVYTALENLTSEVYRCQSAADQQRIEESVNIPIQDEPNIAAVVAEEPFAQRISDTNEEFTVSSISPGTIVPSSIPINKINDISELELQNAEQILKNAEVPVPKLNIAAKHLKTEKFTPKPDSNAQPLTVQSSTDLFRHQLQLRTNKIEDFFQARGSGLPYWFPGFYTAFPGEGSLVTVQQSPSDAMLTAWIRMQPKLLS